MDVAVGGGLVFVSRDKMWTGILSDRLQRTSLEIHMR